MPLNFNNKDIAAGLGTVNGPAHDTQGFVNWSMTTKTTGTVTSGVVVLQGSPNNVDWATLATRTLAAGGVFNDSTSNLAMKWVRVAITTAIGGGGTVDVWLTSAGPLPNDTGWSS